LLRVLCGLFVIFLAGAIFLSVLNSSPEIAAKLSLSDKFVRILGFSEGLFYISFALWVLLRMLNAFMFSCASSKWNLLAREPLWNGKSEISYAAAVALSSLKDADVVGSFCRSFIGARILMRLGISKDEIESFLSKERRPVSSSSAVFMSKSGKVARLSDVVEAVFSADETAAVFLAEKRASVRLAVETAEWVEREFENIYRGRRWWGREHLGRIKGIGKDWSYGSAWRLLRYGKDISESPLFVSSGEAEMKLASGAGEQLESVLSRARETNALLVGDAGSPREAAVNFLAARIADGSVLPALEHKRIIIFDSESFISDTKTKVVFERELFRLFREIEESGNLIVVLANFPSFIESAAELGSDVARVLDEYISGNKIQIIAISETGAFHKVLEPDAGLMKRFEKIIVSAPLEKSILPYAENEASRIEKKTGLFFVYQTVESAVKTASRYFMSESLLDKTADILYEAANRAASDRRAVVLPSDVLTIVEKRTGIPAGELTETERAALLNLEENLRKRVIGQDGALSAVAASLRRARAGTANPNRPFGSFLFLGPTGVGKTETAKALADAFFGGESTIQRIDLSEYKTSDALERLIGSFTKGIPGVMSSMLREKPYGVLLLDEFEKTTTDIKHLFLQILDEGFFTNAGGKRVNCRNLIIIATSNAGSDLIWSSAQGGGNLAGDKKKIINALVERGIYTPELLNRFDGVILFEPLVGKNLRIVAKMMLQKLAARLMERGISFVPTERLVDVVMESGTDPQFGARAMQRAVTEKVERAIADKILRGELRPGSRIELSPEELV
jgi:ATP-dependent Clp protease ATP-binding subunit ClpC